MPNATGVGGRRFRFSYRRMSCLVKDRGYCFSAWQASRRHAGEVPVLLLLESLKTAPTFAGP
jgi:hypothetical protein